MSFSKEQLTEEAARAICAYLGLQPTISISEQSPDAAPTDGVQAVTASDIARARGGKGSRPR